MPRSAGSAAAHQQGGAAALAAPDGLGQRQLRFVIPQSSAIRPSAIRMISMMVGGGSPVWSAGIGKAEGARDKRGTRPAILAAAQELFAARGYAGTSIADIAGRLGMSKAALYYHFRSKTEILRALLEEPVAAYSRLADSAADGRLRTGELLGAVIDTTADLHALVDVIGNDPSARSALQDLLSRSREVNEAITAALAGPRPDPASIIRAHAAYAAAKNGTLALLTARGSHLTQQDRAELLAAAERALTARTPA